MKKWKVRAYRLAIGCLPSPRRETKTEGSVPDGLAEALRRHHAVSAAVQLFDRNGPTGMLLWGNARAGTAFRSASVTKHITAMAAWRLHEADMIDLDADTDPFLPCSLRHPEAPDVPVTLRMLLSHTAGIHDGAAYTAACLNDPPLQDVMRGDIRGRIPGQFEYSNFGAGIAACVLEGMLGKSFERILHEAVLDVLHVRASCLPQTITDPITDSYRVLPPSRKPALDAAARKSLPLPADAPDPERHYLFSQGNLYISAPMLGRLGTELLRDRYAPMRHRIASFGDRDPRLGMGLGTFIVQGITDRTLYGHQGLAYGAVHGLFYDPEAGKGFALLTGGCSEAREGVLADINIAVMKLVF